MNNLHRYFSLLTVDVLVSQDSCLSFGTWPVYPSHTAMLLSTWWSMSFRPVRRSLTALATPSSSMLFFSSATTFMTPAMPRRTVSVWSKTDRTWLARMLSRSCRGPISRTLLISKLHTETCFSLLAGLASAVSLTTLQVRESIVYAEEEEIELLTRIWQIWWCLSLGDWLLVSVLSSRTFTFASSWWCLHIVLPATINDALKSTVKTGNVTAKGFPTFSFHMYFKKQTLPNNNVLPLIHYFTSLDKTTSLLFYMEFQSRYDDCIVASIKETCLFVF